MDDAEGEDAAAQRQRRHQRDGTTPNNPTETASRASPTTDGLVRSRSGVASLVKRITSSSPSGDPSGDGLQDTTATTSSSTDSTPGDASDTPAATAPVTTPSKYEVGWRRVVRNFSPSWFSVTMGTGIVSLVLVTIPFRADWLYWTSVAFFGLNTVLFTAALTASVLRYSLYPEIWGVMVADPTNSLFLGTVPMGFATLVEAWIFLCCPYWGEWSVKVAWVCWMVDAVVAAAVTVSLPFLLMSHSHQNMNSLERITAAQLLPIAATIVASGTGSEVAGILSAKNPPAAFGTLITSYVMWGMATPFAMTVLVMYYHRLAVHKLPPREVVVSSFLPLGPLGMGGYTILNLGKVAREQVLPRVTFLPSVSEGVVGDIAFVLGFFVSLIMWGFGLCWFVFAVATISSSRPFPFNMGWWGFTFPLGVYAISTMSFGVEMPSLFFRVLGTIFGVFVVILWGVVAAGTARGAWSGRLFNAPCLKNLKPRPEDEADASTLDQEKLQGR